jgi:hypothetical protein
MTYASHFDPELAISDERRNVQVNTRQTLLTKILLENLAHQFCRSEADIIEMAISEFSERHDRKSASPSEVALETRRNVEENISYICCKEGPSFDNYGRPWSRRDDKILREHFQRNKQSSSALARELGRTSRAINARAAQLGIAKGA